MTPNDKKLVFGQDTVRKVADLARLQLSDQEIEKFSQQVGQILGYIDKLNSLDTKNVEPMATALDIATPTRADETQASPGAETMLAVAPEHLLDSYKVPQVLGGT